MAKFLLKNGPHYVPGREEPFLPGDVITSDIPLDEKFKNKFEKISGPIPSKPSKAEEPEEEVSANPFKIVTVARGKYDVVKIATDEKINDEPLTKTQAVKLAGEDAPIEKASRRKRKSD